MSAKIEMPCRVTSSGWRLCVRGLVIGAACALLAPPTVAHTRDITCGAETGNAFDLRFGTARARVGALVQICGGLRRWAPGELELFLIPTPIAERLGDARERVGDSRRILAPGGRRLWPVGSGALRRARIPRVAPGAYTLAYWCRSCHGLLGAIWPDRSIATSHGYARIRVVG
jgi:hypothetical protein